MKCYQRSITQCVLPAAMLERWPQVCRVKITMTFEFKDTTAQLVRFYHQKKYEMLISARTTHEKKKG